MARIKPILKYSYPPHNPSPIINFIEEAFNTQKYQSPDDGVSTFFVLEEQLLISSTSMLANAVQEHS